MSCSKKNPRTDEEVGNLCPTGKVTRSCLRLDDSSEPQSESNRENMKQW